MLENKKEIIGRWPGVPSGWKIEQSNVGMLASDLHVAAISILSID